MTFKIRGGENINFAVPINYARALLGFETLMSLDELALKLRQANVSLFAEKDGDKSLSGVWLSLSRNNRRTLRQDGDYLYGTWDADDVNGTYDLKKQENGSYQGIYTTIDESLWYRDCGNCAKIDVSCRFTDELILTEVSTGRIEGKIRLLRYPKKTGPDQAGAWYNLLRRPLHLTY